MVEIIGMELDWELMQADPWTIYFTESIYKGQGVIRNIEPAIIRLNPEDYEEHQLEKYDVYYDPLTGKYQIEPNDPDVLNMCPLYGILLGHFLINGCNVKFMYPEPDVCVTYVRAFSEEYDSGYEDTQEQVDSCVDQCNAFSFDFNTDFQIDCGQTINP